VRLHPRTQHVSGAAATIRLALLDLQGELGLTDVEMLRVQLEWDDMRRVVAAAVAEAKAGEDIPQRPDAEGEW